MKEAALFHSLMWKNFTGYFFTGILIAALGLLIVDPGIREVVTPELTKDFLFTYTALRLITAAPITVVEFGMHILGGKND